MIPSRLLALTACAALAYEEFSRALAAPDVRERTPALGAEPGGGTSAQFAAYIRAEAEKYAGLVKSSAEKAD